MKKTILLLVAMLFCIQPFGMLNKPKQKDEWKSLIKELLFIRNFGLEKIDPELLRVVAVVLKDLEDSGDITLNLRYALSEALVYRFSYLRDEGRCGLPLAISIRTAASILNRNMTKSVVERKINPRDLDHYIRVINDAKNDLSLRIGADNLGGEEVKKAFINTTRVIESNDPSMALNIDEIRSLRSLAPIVEFGGYEEAAHAMLVAAAMASNKLNYVIHESAQTVSR